MLRVVVVLCGLVALAGCRTMPADVAFYHKTGTTIFQKQAAYDQCKIQSFKEIPQAIGTRVTPGMSSPGTTYCNSYGYGSVTCNTYGGYNIPPRVDNYDMNAGLRERYMASCMYKSGYTLTVIPYCKGDEVGYSAVDPAPPLSRIQCIDRSSPTLQ